MLSTLGSASSASRVRAAQERLQEALTDFGVSARGDDAQDLRVVGRVGHSVLNEYAGALALETSAFILKTPKTIDFLSTACAPMPLAPRRLYPNVAMKQPACAPTFYWVQSIPRPNTTDSRWNCSEHLNGRQSTRRNPKPLLHNNQERTNRNTTETMEGPETTTMTPLARNKQHI